MQGGKMKKKITAVLAAMITCALASTTVFAADAPQVIFDGNSKEFVYDTSNSDFGDAFKDIIPGETRTLNFSIKNTSDENLQFYFTAKTANDFTAAEGAAYGITFSRDSENFYTGTLGGKSGSLTNLQVGNAGTGASSLTDRLLVASLAPGENQSISMTMTLDGETAGNDYQGKEAKFAFTFLAAYDNSVPTTVTVHNPGENIVTNKTTYGSDSTVYSTKSAEVKGYTTKVKTGDTSNTAALLVLMIAAGAVITIVVATRRKAGDKQ